MPEYKFNMETGKLEAKSFVKASFKHTCSCGKSYDLGMEWPEGLITQGEINLTQFKCPSCGKEGIILPKARYEVIDSKLVASPIEES